MMNKLKHYWIKALYDWNYLFREELRNIFRDQGVLVFCIVVPLAYPVLYSFIYNNEVVREVPIAVVDDSRTSVSREYARRLDATADVKVISYCANMQEAQVLIKHRDALGAVYIPRDFSDRLASGRQVKVDAYSDMSGMLYYKSILTANTNVSLDLNARIKVARGGGMTAEQDDVAEHPITYEEVTLYNPQNGFATFLIPAVLILVIQQTLLLGIGLSAGTAREQNKYRNLIPFERHHTGLLRIVWSKSFAYLLVYIPICVYILGVIPHLFEFNQLGVPQDIFFFVLPYLFACIFFGMTVSAFVRHREMVILLIVFTSVPLLFISGISWPGSAVPSFWKAISYIFPSTFGIKGFVAINNMGANLLEVRHEWNMMWGQAVIYCLTTCIVYRTAVHRAAVRNDE